MQTIQSARLKPGVTVESIPGPEASPSSAGPGSRQVIRGTALIFWDPKVPGRTRKLDAIDTDQITPATDCVSESLDTLDERWKAGAFRYLMPDFRARVHRGETFVIAGDRFAIGSSREMSPAGLKAIAEEVGLEMVIVCGHNMGDIFRRNALNLGLQVVQSPDAAADARDGDAFSFDPESRQLTNETQGKTYDPVPLTAKEDEIRSTGGIFTVGRRELRASVRTTPLIDWPDEARARRMTSTEQIVWAHRVDKTAEIAPGATLRVYADLLPASDGTAPFAIHTFNQITGGQAIFPRPGGDRQRSLRVHRQGRRRPADGDRAAVRAAARHREAVLRDAGRRDFHFYFPEQGLVAPGQFIPGADSHSRAYGAVRRGRHRHRIDDARLRLVDRIHLLHRAEGAPCRLHRHAAAVGERQGHRARIAAAVGATQAQGMSVELVDANRQLPMAYRTRSPT
jgi:3-isopropylmalate/(R)-2-methylmalate dehydratase small subunit